MSRFRCKVKKKKKKKIPRSGVNIHDGAAYVYRQGLEVYCLTGCPVCVYMGSRGVPKHVERILCVDCV